MPPTRSTAVRAAILANYELATAGITVNLQIAGAQIIGGDQGTDTLLSIENVVGSAFDDAITGDGNDNSLIGSSGNDTLTAGDGADNLRGDAGNDVLNGGAGIDTASYAFAVGNIVANLQTGKATGEGTDTLSGIENLVSGSGNDQLIGDAKDNVLDGGQGNDLLFGKDGDDTLIGGGGSNMIVGGDGNRYRRLSVRLGWCDRAPADRHSARGALQ